MGWLRQNKRYRAKARFYPGGPVSTIEYYPAAPGATWYQGVNAFWPMAEKIGVPSVGVGELTNAGGRSRVPYPFDPPPPGLGHIGTESDFAGLTPYPGPPAPEDLPDCSTVEPPPPPPDREPDRLRVTLTGLILSVDGTEHTLTHEVVTSFHFTGGEYYGFDPVDGAWQTDVNFRYVGLVAEGWIGFFWGRVASTFFGMEFETTNDFHYLVTTSTYLGVKQTVFPLGYAGEPDATVVSPGSITITPEWD